MRSIRAMMIGVMIIALLIGALFASNALATEPRPWLCRDKPVFSSSQPMSYDLSASGRQWRLFLMQFSPGGGNDGFAIAKTLDGASSGNLPPGRYFAVALHSSGGRWICPAEAREQPRSSDAVSKLCFAEQEGGCAVKLVVKSDPQKASPRTTVSGVVGRAAAEAR